MEFFDTDVKNVDSFEVNAVLTDSQGTQHLYESGKSYHNASSSFINVTLVSENGLVKGQIQFGFGKFKKNLENVICN